MKNLITLYLYPATYVKINIKYMLKFTDKMNTKEKVRRKVGAGKEEDVEGGKEEVVKAGKEEEEKAGKEEEVKATKEKKVKEEVKAGQEKVEKEEEGEMWSPDHEEFSRLIR